MSRRSPRGSSLPSSKADKDVSIADEGEEEQEDGDVGVDVDDDADADVEVVDVGEEDDDGGKEANGGEDEYRPDEAEGEGEGDGDDDDDEPAEEEYEVEKILDHKGTKGKYTYLVAWKGYGPEHNTWEPQANVEHAQDLVDQYWAKQPKHASFRSSQKRKAADSPVPTPTATRKYTSASQPVKRTTRARTPIEDDDVQFADTHRDDPGQFMDDLNWDSLVSHIDTIEQGSNQKLIVYLTMKNGAKITVASDIVNLRMPQTVIKFYERHLKWREAGV